MHPVRFVWLGASLSFTEKQSEKASWRKKLGGYTRINYCAVQSITKSPEWHEACDQRCRDESEIWKNLIRYLY